MKRRVIVIGVGIFGSNVVKQLAKMDCEVIAIDKDKDAIQDIAEYCSKAIVADGTDKSIYKEFGLQESDLVVISFGENLSDSSLITVNLRKMGIRSIYVKAPNDEYKLVLEKVGATEVIIPEKEVAIKLADSIVRPGVLDYFPLSEDYKIFEIAPPQDLLGRSLLELQLPKKFNVYVIAVRDILSDSIFMMPGAEFKLKDGQVLIVIGRDEDIGKIK
jgi:trk system potassium uptake protein TrkA